MAEDPLIHQRFVQGTHKHGDMLSEAQRAHENTRHVRSLKGRSVNWPAAILAFILFAGVVGGLFFLYQVTGAADAAPSTYP